MEHFGQYLEKSKNVFSTVFSNFQSPGADSFFREKGLKKIPFNSESSYTLFTRPKDTGGNTNPEELTLGDRYKIPFIEHLGNLLRKYMEFLVEAMTDHNLKIANCTFPLMTANPKHGGTEIKSNIMKILDDSDSLRQQMRTFKGTWEANTIRSRWREWRCYEAGPAQWIYKVIKRNDENVKDKMKKIYT